MLPAFVTLFIVTCDAPFIFHFIIEQLSRSLPGAKRRVAHLYSMNSIQLSSTPFRSFSIVVHPAPASGG